MGTPRTISTLKRQKFIEGLRTHANITKAASEAGLMRHTVYEIKAKNPDFSEAWEDALEESYDALEGEARRRAVDGVKEPIMYGGKVVAAVTKYSDSLLMFVLKAKRPEFRDKVQAELTGLGGNPLALTFAQLVSEVDSDSRKDQ